MVQNIDIKDIADGQRKLNALVRNHIGNVNGHPLATANFAGFQSVDDKKESYFMGNRGIGFPSGVTKTTDLSFGLYYGNFSQLTDMPIKQEAPTALIKVQGWGPLTLPDENTMISGDSTAQLKKITCIIGQTENNRIVSSTGKYDSGWDNDFDWLPQKILNGKSGHVNAIRKPNGMTGRFRVDVEFNLTGNFNKVEDIIELLPGYAPDSYNVIAFSGFGQPASGSTLSCSFAIHGNKNIEFIPTTSDTLTSVNGYLSYISGAPTV